VNAIKVTNKTLPPKDANFMKSALSLTSDSVSISEMDIPLSKPAMIDVSNRYKDKK